MTRALFWLVVSDLLDRTRRKGFVVAALAMAVLATLYLPSAEASYVTATVGEDVRGLYDSAWIGAVTACLSSLLFTLAAFFLVRGSVARDEATRFGQILAATPVSGVEYILGKTLSTFCYLAALTGLIALSGAAIQLVRAEDLAVNPLELLLPTVAIVWPTMLLVSAIAVLFECVPLLRGGLGSVAYFALYLYAVAGLTLGDSVYQPTPDPLGVRLALEEMSRAAAGTAGLGPAPEPNVGINLAPPDLATFDFAGLSLGAEALLGRLAWASASLVAVLAAALAFSRFDPARAAGPVAGLLPAVRGARPHRDVPAGPEASPKTGRTGTRQADVPAGPPIAQQASLSRLGDAPRSGRFPALVAAELRLALKGRSPWWYAGVVALVGAGALLPLENARAFVLPLALLWPLTLWSSLGCRERRHRTEEIFLSAPGARTAGTLAPYLAGVAVALLASGGVAAKMALTGEPSGLVGLAAGALFVPALALACGVVSGGGTLFEGTYLPLWYVGPLNKVAALDFASTSGGPGHAPLYLGLAAALVCAALVLRWRA